MDAGDPIVGGYRPAMVNTCGHSDRPTDPDAPECGRPPVLHAWVGPQDDSAVLLIACERHAAIAMKLATDWHDIGPVCDVPGTRWQFFETPGAGFCFWPAADQALAAELLELTETRTGNI